MTGSAAILCASEVGGGSDVASTIVMPCEWSTGVMLEINNARVSPFEGFACLSLHRDRLDKDFVEATYVSSDNARTAKTLHFKVFNGDFLLLCGTLHKGAKDGVWSMYCCSTMHLEASKQQQQFDKVCCPCREGVSTSVILASC